MPRTVLFLLVLGILGLLGVGLMVYATPYGIGLWLDSMFYLSAARNFVAGLGLGRMRGCEGFEPLTHYPPLYSLMLAAFAPLGLDAVRAARVISALSLGATVVLVGLLLYQISRRPWVALLGASLVLGASEIWRNFSWVLSEPPYFPLYLGCFVLLGWYFEPMPGKRAAGKCFLPHPLLVAAGLLAGAAWLTRLVGVTVITTAGLALLLSRKSGEVSWRQRLVEAGWLVLLACLPIFVWMLRNLMVSGTAADRVLGWYPPEREVWILLAQTIIAWFMPVRWFAGHEKVGLALVLVLLALALLVLPVLMKARKLKPPPITASVTFLLAANGIIYFLLLLVTRIFFDRATPLDSRILIPVYLNLLILIVAVLASAPEEDRARNKVATAARLAGWALLLALSIWR